MKADDRPNTRRGTAHYLDLPMYQNDVFNALNRTGGIPDANAFHDIVVYRTRSENKTDVIRIPLRVRDGEPLPFEPSDVILESGDVVFIEARESKE